MTASGKVSCLRRRKREEAGAAGQYTNALDHHPKNDGAACTDGGSSSPRLSVTIVSKEQLPSYSSERFYLLSEIHLRAAETIFLNERSGSQDDDEDATADTAGESVDGDNDGGAGGTKSSSPPLFVILYLLWRPEMTSNPQEFLQTVVLSNVSKLETFVLSAPTSSPSESATCPSVMVQENGTISTKSEQSTAFTNNSNKTSFQESKVAPEDSQPESSPSVYIVVDRVLPPPLAAAARHAEPFNNHTNSNSNSNEKPMEKPAAAGATTTSNHALLLHQTQEELAHDLARHIASHPRLRPLTQGVVVAVSNHERAAPGLEAIANAMTFYEKDRRQNSTRLVSTYANHQEDPSKSLLTLVTDEPNTLLGLQRPSETDAAQGILQCRLHAEWSGHGNLPSFAKRAQDAWRIQRGLLPITATAGKSGKRKLPRRIPRIQQEQEPTTTGPSPFQRNRTIESLLFGGGKPSQLLLLLLPSWLVLDSRSWQEVLYEYTVVLGIVGYLVFHYWTAFVWLLERSNWMWEDVTQTMREW